MRVPFFIYFLMKSYRTQVDLRHIRHVPQALWKRPSQTIVAQKEMSEGAQAAELRRDRPGESKAGVVDC